MAGIWASATNVPWLESPLWGRDCHFCCKLKFPFKPCAALSVTSFYARVNSSSMPFNWNVSFLLLQGQGWSQACVRCAAPFCRTPTPCRTTWTTCTASRTRSSSTPRRRSSKKIWVNRVPSQKSLVCLFSIAAMAPWLSVNSSFLLKTPKFEMLKLYLKNDLL